MSTRPSCTPRLTQVMAAAHVLLALAPPGEVARCLVATFGFDLAFSALVHLPGEAAGRAGGACLHLLGDQASGVGPDVAADEEDRGGTRG